MSYDIEFSVKVEGCGKHIRIGAPVREHPTYNYGKLFRACMDWDYSQGEKNEDGSFEVCYYDLAFVLKKVKQGIKELLVNGQKYEHLLPDNGWGTMRGARECLESIIGWINDFAREHDDIPLECVYMSW